MTDSRRPMVQEQGLSSWVVADVLDSVEVLGQEQQIHHVGWRRAFYSASKVSDRPFQAVHDGTDK